jgi:hypothetical protein
VRKSEPYRGARRAIETGNAGHAVLAVVAGRAVDAILARMAHVALLAILAILAGRTGHADFTRLAVAALYMRRGWRDAASQHAPTACG